MLLHLKALSVVDGETSQAELQELEDGGFVLRMKGPDFDDTEKTAPTLSDVLLVAETHGVEQKLRNNAEDGERLDRTGKGSKFC